MAVYGAYVEKKAAFAVEADAALADIHGVLQLAQVRGVRLFQRYFVEHIAQEDFEAAKYTIFSEPQVDDLYESLPKLDGFRVFGVEYLPGQFDQRADSAAQCASLATGKERPTVRSARIYAVCGDITDAQFSAIKSYLINPVESREASLDTPSTLDVQFDIPTSVEIVDGFISLDRDGLSAMLGKLGLAMDLDDLSFCQNYFKDTERRDPSITEIRMIDTYWSDHCRHTTFLTVLDGIEIEDEEIRGAHELYLSLRGELGRENKPVTLMDMATIGARALKSRGMLPDLDESEEINACSVKIKVDVDGRDENWLLMFKNETHNHPTEIEPFGGAATCLGGAIRDPLSGRSYVYQAMRITGAADPLKSAGETMPGKLPQRKLVRTAAAGYSSYGNQIGLATGHVHEIYHPGYVAKRMELGAVIGAAPAENVVRETPEAGDLVILLGGRTGRDGCGGATGSSKSHTLSSLETCGAEVQKGNAPEERKIQRLFRDPNATRLIRRCNDFGAGGVSVAIGELADGLLIDLDAVPKKYDGLDGTELAISESQERMAVVVRAKDAGKFIELATRENLEATVVARVIETPRLKMDWQGRTIVDLSREFLNSNGASKHIKAAVAKPAPIEENTARTLDENGMIKLLGSLSACSQKGLVERFGSTIGCGTILTPFGGAHAITPAQAMVAKIPVPSGETNTCSIMAWGFDPFISSESPYHGAMLAVVESVAKVLAAGGTMEKCWLSFQEYFERLRSEPYRWGKPAAALLGALKAQMELGCGAIGGKDSMSGSFEDIDVPPTLVSFAVSTAQARRVISTEFKSAGSPVYLLMPKYNGRTPDFEDVRKIFSLVEKLTAENKILSSWALGARGTGEAIPKMCFGNRFGLVSSKPLEERAMVGGFILEAAETLPGLDDMLLGHTMNDYAIALPGGDEISLYKVEKAFTGTLEPVYPVNAAGQGTAALEAFSYNAESRAAPKIKISKPRVAIPVFPGTNCEYDTARAFEKAGAQADIFVVRNLTPGDISGSVEAFARLVSQSQIIAVPGGFSGGDEPDGSGKFITAFFRNAKVTDAVMELLKNRDGLMCGICNGFQALIKLGLVPFGEILAMDADCPTLAFNSIGRHQSMLAHTRISSNKSPWFSALKVGDIYTAPCDHGEGRFIANDELVRRLAANGQIAAQYVGLDGNPTEDIRFNPNNSAFAVECITSPDGRVLGKMLHTERYGENLYKNIPGNTFMDIFSGAVRYWN